MNSSLYIVVMAVASGLLVFAVVNQYSDFCFTCDDFNDTSEAKAKNQKIKELEQARDKAFLEMQQKRAEYNQALNDYNMRGSSTPSIINTIPTDENIQDSDSAIEQYPDSIIIYSPGSGEFKSITDLLPKKDDYIPDREPDIPKTCMLIDDIWWCNQDFQSTNKNNKR